MAEIHVLDQDTINKIAAGEVIERPASVVKELLENAIDANATAVTVEIRDGGTSLIRVTDNGRGIGREDIPLAFLSHATSKIQSVEDLFTVASLGFRGEALSSIAAVSQVELITKTAGSITGIRYQIEGGAEQGMQEIGAPDGTTFLVRNLFYNTPVRRKFLKTPATEGAHVADLVEKIALSHPEVSIRLIQNSQSRLHTSGNHNVKDIIYTVYGREIASQLLAVESRGEPVRISGYIGKPVIARNNRNFELYFINGRYIKSSIIGKAIEEAYKPFMMQHKYPFTLLYFTIEPEFLDVNVHPTKMELRFRDGEAVFRAVRDALSQVLMHRELIPEVALDDKQQRRQEANRLRGQKRIPLPEPFETKREKGEGMLASASEIREPSPFYHSSASVPAADFSRPVREEKGSMRPGTEALTADRRQTEPRFRVNRELTALLVGNRRDLEEKEPLSGAGKEEQAEGQQGAEPQAEEQLAEGRQAEEQLANDPSAQEPVPEENVPETLEDPKTCQMELFSDGEKLLEPKSRVRHRLIGQLFGTYWMVEFKDQLYIIDQHAAHEKVLYEKTMASLKTRQYTCQQITPPIILTLSSGEALMLEKHKKAFCDIGFEIEPFGGREYAVRGVPDNLFSIAKKDLLLEMIDNLSEDTLAGNPDMIYEKVASMSCKAAVKGNHAMSVQEADQLIDQLLELENPYACPHGRPTIISMSKYELEKKFKRIV